MMPNTDTALLELDQLTVGHGPCAVLEQVSMAVHAGDIVCVLGPNGCGKSTLLSTCLGLLKPLAGQSLLQGKPVSALTPAQRASKVSHVAQHVAEQLGFRVLDWVVLGRSARWSGFWGSLNGPQEADYAQAKQALAELGIATLAQRLYSELSGGQQQLVRIAQAVCQDAPLMTLDEPTANLDLANTEQVLHLLEQWAKHTGRGVLFTTHDPQQALRLNAQVLMLNQGRVMAFGQATDVLTNINLSALYNHPVERVDTPHGPWVRPSQSPR